MKWLPSFAETEWNLQKALDHGREPPYLRSIVSAQLSVPATVAGGDVLAYIEEVQWVSMVRSEILMSGVLGHSGCQSNSAEDLCSLGYPHIFFVNGEVYERVLRECF